MSIYSNWIFNLYSWAYFIINYNKIKRQIGSDYGIAKLRRFSSLVFIFLIYNFDSYQIKLTHALLFPFNPHLHLQISHLKYRAAYQAITKANQLSSVPGPADYTIKKPLHKSGTIASTTETRNLYKKF